MSGATAYRLNVGMAQLLHKEANPASYLAKTGQIENAVFFRSILVKGGETLAADFTHSPTITARRDA